MLGPVGKTEETIFPFLAGSLPYTGVQAKTKIENDSFRLVIGYPIILKS